MRIAILGDYPLNANSIVGGVEAVVRYLTMELSCFDNLDIHVVTLRSDLAHAQVCRDGKTTAHYVPAAYRFANVTLFAVNKFRVLRELTCIQPDLIHAHIAGQYAQMAHLSGRPYVLTPHGIRHREEWLQQGWFNQTVRRPLVTREEFSCIRRARHLIAISPYVRGVFGTWIHGAVYPIENPIAESFYQLPAQVGSDRLLYVGKITRRKGPLELIQALARLRDQGCRPELHLAGVPDSADMAYLNALRGVVHDLRLDAQVHFLGQLDEAHLLDEYARCAGVVLPSHQDQETAPMAIQQAMAAARPVVATRVGGIPYLVDHGETGWLVPPRDVDPLADALGRLLEDADRRQRFGQHAREQAIQRFRAATVAHRTREVYHTVFEESHHARPCRDHHASTLA
jgi:glycosyltransferase involved in cell wall biosynthesis